MTEPMLPPALAESVRRDLRRVRPLLPPTVRTTLVMIVGIAAAALFVASVGVRGDLRAMPPALFAAAIAARVALGLLMITIALREAVPSRGVPHAISLGTLIVAAAVVLALPIMVGRIVAAAEATPARAQIICYRAELLVAAPAFLLTAWLLGRAYPLRPMRAAVAAGAGTGLLADAALFTHCTIDVPRHVLIAHEGAVLSLAVAGALLAALAWRRRSRVNAPIDTNV